MQIFNYIGLSACALLVMASDCSGSSTNPVGPHPTPIVTDSASCEAAQANLLAEEGTPMAKANGLHHGCAEGEPTKKGKSFAQFCMETQKSGIALYPKCLAKIDSCSQINRVTSTGMCPVP